MELTELEDFVLNIPRTFAAHWAGAIAPPFAQEGDYLFGLELGQGGVS
jgi:hypothetical protein